MLVIGISIVIQELKLEIQDQMRYSKFMLRGEVSIREKGKDSVRVGTKEMKLDGGAKWEIEESFTANTIINRRRV